MIKVIKKSGKSEDFNIQKIKTTLANASDELKEPLSESDIELISEDVLSKLNSKDSVRALEIFNTLIETLKSLGFNKLAKAYEKGI